jgi:5,10-methylenetetrahydrofolate reductase
MKRKEMGFKMTFKEKLKSKKFLITAELFPPKGTDISTFLRRAENLKNLDAVNVTDNQRASMRAGSLAMSKILLEKGIEPIFQITARDRNRIALQSDLISADILGINNVLVLSGDHPSCGDHPNAKPVYDLDTVQLIKTARLLETGIDLAGKKLNAPPSFCLGAAINPSAKPDDLQVLAFKKKVLAGAEFFQTQTVFDMDEYEKFFMKIKQEGIRVLAGITFLRSVKFMRFLNDMPGVEIPLKIQEAIEKASDPLAQGIEICRAQIERLKTFADGVHIMAIGAEEYIPDILS